MNTRIRSALLLGPLLFAASAFAQDPAVDPATVLASTANIKVTYEDLQAELARIPEKERFEFLMNRNRLATMVENILINKTLASEARARKLDSTPSIQAEMRNQVDKVLAKYRGQDVQKNAPKINLEPKARELYLTQQEALNTPAQYEIWHVLVDLKGRTRAEAQARIAEVRDRLIKGESQEDLVRTYSDDISKRNNKGNLGYLKLSSFDPAFAEAAKKLKVGEISGIVETQFGFHVMKLLGIVPERKVSFEEAKPYLMREAEYIYEQSVWEAHIMKIREDSTLKVNTDALDKVRPKIPELPPLPTTLKK